MNPATPQNEDGIRIDPPMSDPVASVVLPAASAAAEPPLEPPGEYARFHGLRVTPPGTRWHCNDLGLPVLDDVLAWLQLALIGCPPAGDHALVIGQVVAS